MPLPYQGEDTWFDPVMTIPDMLRHAGIAHHVTTLEQLQQPALTVDSTPDEESGVTQVIAQLTAPGGRPEVYMRSLHFALTAGITATPITANRLSVDQIIIDVPSTAVNSVFFGYGNAISTASGLEVRPGIPLVWQPDNTREQWELQRMLEYMGLVLGLTQNLPNLPTYRAPRVVLDPSQYSVVASVATNISVGLVYVPELQ